MISRTGPGPDATSDPAPDPIAKPWTLGEVDERVAEAVHTLKRVPSPVIQRSVTRWPAFMHDVCEACREPGFRLSPAPAAPAAIDRLDETLGWLRWLPLAAQRILWSRASGFSWRRIAHYVGKSPNTCRAWHLAALHHIVARLNGHAGSFRHTGSASQAGSVRKIRERNHATASRPTAPIGGGRD